MVVGRELVRVFDKDILVGCYVRLWESRTQIYVFDWKVSYLDQFFGHQGVNGGNIWHRGWTVGDLVESVSIP